MIGQNYSYGVIVFERLGKGNVQYDYDASFG